MQGYIIAANEATDAKTFVLMGDGNVELFGAEAVVVDAESAAEVIAVFDAQGNHMPVDFEHSTVFKAGKGEPSPAAGWVTSLTYEAGVGIVATVEWTGEGSKLIKSKQYKYYSPVIHFDKESRRVESVSSVALTNTPRMKNIEALAASTTTGGLPMAGSKKTETIVAAEHEGADMGGGGDMTMKLALALKDAGVEVSEESTPDDVLAMALQFIKENSSAPAEDAPAEDAAPAAPVAASATLGVIGAENDEQGVLMLKQKFVTRQDYEALSQRVEAAEELERGRQIDAKVGAYIKCNKLLAADDAQIAAARKFAGKDYDGWVEFMDAQPEIIQSGRVTPTTASVSGTSRQRVIAAAKTQFVDTAQSRNGHDMDQWINQTLRDEDLDVLTDSERTAILA